MRLPSTRGDQNEVTRVIWLEGRIAAGLGRPEEALALLAQARREFDSAACPTTLPWLYWRRRRCCLRQVGRAEVKGLAGELAKVFKSKGVHREALAALQLFREAAEREKATAELARRVLAYLFRARHDQGLSFEPHEQLGLPEGSIPQPLGRRLRLRSRQASAIGVSSRSLLSWAICCRLRRGRPRVSSRPDGLVTPSEEAKAKARRVLRMGKGLLSRLQGSEPPMARTGRAPNPRGARSVGRGEI